MRKTPSFSSSLLDSILRSVDETNETLDHDRMSSDSNPKIHLPLRQLLNEEEQTMIDKWTETLNKNNYVSRSETETLSTYRSLPISFKMSPKTVLAIFTQKEMSTSKPQGKFMKSTKLRAMKIYGDLKKGKQSRISAFICSLFTSSSSKKSKIQSSHDTCTSSSRSKKQHGSSVQKSVRYFPENDTNPKSIDERKSSSMPLSKYEKQWFIDNNYMKNYKIAMGIMEDDDEDGDEDEADLFELESVGTGTYRKQLQLPVF